MGGVVCGWRWRWVTPFTTLYLTPVTNLVVHSPARLTLSAHPHFPSLPLTSPRSLCSTIGTWRRCSGCGCHRCRHLCCQVKAQRVQGLCQQQQQVRRPPCCDCLRSHPWREQWACCRCVGGKGLGQGSGVVWRGKGAAGQTSSMLRLPAESPLAGAMGVLQVCLGRGERVW